MKKVLAFLECRGVELEKVLEVESLSTREEIREFLNENYPDFEESFIEWICGEEHFEPWSEEFWQELIQGDPESGSFVLGVGEEYSFWVTDPETVEGKSPEDITEMYLDYLTEMYN